MTTTVFHNPYFYQIQIQNFSLCLNECAWTEAQCFLCSYPLLLRMSVSDCSRPTICDTKTVKQLPLRAFVHNPKRRNKKDRVNEVAVREVKGLLAIPIFHEWTSELVALLWHDRAQWLLCSDCRAKSPRWLCLQCSCVIGREGQCRPVRFAVALASFPACSVSSSSNRLVKSRAP